MSVRTDFIEYFEGQGINPRLNLRARAKEYVSFPWLADLYSEDPTDISWRIELYDHITTYYGD